MAAANAQISSRYYKLCKDAGIKDCMVDVLHGDPRHVICEAVEDMHAATLIVGSRGMGKHGGTLGSVSDYCVHHCRCPVVVVRGDIKQNA